ncbi:uncharacterized protein [Henckelia pumila]|uniref:uncharacterized protein n=1 Tax=Henckelia pumila TaxID=405737 RepID=UPI003C6E438A
MIRDKLVGDSPVHDVLRSDEPESFGFGVLSDFDDDADESYKESGYSISSDEDNLDLVSEESIDEGVFDDRKKKNKSKEVTTDDGWCSDPVDDDDEILSVYGSDDDAPKHPVYKEGQDMTNFKLMVGMKFKSTREFKFVLSDVSVKGGIEVVFYKNEKSRITVVCKEEECEWKIHASLVMGGPTFQIKTLKGRHTCSKAATSWLANYKYLAKKIEQVVRENPNVKTNQLINYIKRECGVNVSKWKAVRAKKYALQSIKGVDNVQYEILMDYCETVLKYNPGSRIIIRAREDCVAPTFGKLYYSLSGLKMNFLTSCRPIIGLDGCFLKTVHGGQLLTAIGRDGNDGMVPIAIAIVEIENRDTWTWFLRELLEDIGGLGENKWTFISDRQKGLIKALKDLVPDSEHSFILEDREKPIISMLEGIRTKLMRKTQERKAGMEKYPGKICPNILKKIEKCQDISRSCFPVYSGDLEYQVQYATAYGVVRKALCGYPCCHACAAIAHNRQKIEDFVDICYTKVEYLKGYTYFIHAVPGEIDYCKSESQPLNL